MNEKAKPRETLLTIPNAHVDTDGGTNHPPEFDPQTDFVAYMPNRLGEQMVYVHRRGESLGVLYHGDYAWEPVAVAPDGKCNMILGEEERFFLAACARACERKG